MNLSIVAPEISPFQKVTRLGDNIFSGKLKWVVGILVIIIMVVAVLWATGFEGAFFNFFFKQDWSGGFWTNVLFIAVIAIVLAIVLKTAKS